MESFSTQAAALRCIPSNFFLEICRSWTTSKKLVLENYVLAYHTADKDQAEILQDFVCVFCVLCKWKSQDKTHPQESRFDATLYIDQNVNQVCQPIVLKIWREWLFLSKNPGDFSLNRDISKSQKKLDSRLFLYSFSQSS